MYIIGILLLMWWVYDLVKGEVWGFRTYTRSSEPFKYWILMGVWLLVVLWCLSPIMYWYF